MPYFIILPTFLILFLLMVSAAITARFVPRWRLASGYLMGGTLGAVLGFLLANVALFFVTYLSLKMDSELSLPEFVRPVVVLVIAAMLFLGPFVVSVGGVLMGFAVGFIIVLWRRSRIQV